MGGRPPFVWPLSVLIEAQFPILASWSNKKQRAAAQRLFHPTVKPDWNNIGGVTDACNHMVWTDDKQIVAAQVVKLYFGPSGLQDQRMARTGGKNSRLAPTPEVGLGMDSGRLPSRARTTRVRRFRPFKEPRPNHRI